MTENTNSINSAIIGFWRMGATPIQITHVVELNLFYKTERKTHPSFLRGWDVSDTPFTY